MTSRQVDAISQRGESDREMIDVFAQDNPEVESLVEHQQAELTALFKQLGLIP